MVSIRRTTIAILRIWCLGMCDSGGEDLLKEAIECLAQRWERCDENANGKLSRAPDPKVDTSPSRIRCLSDGLEFDGFENRADRSATKSC